MKSINTYKNTYLYVVTMVYILSQMERSVHYTTKPLLVANFRFKF